MPTDKINEYFTWKEAACRDGTPVPVDLEYDVMVHADYMRIIRTFLGCAVHVNSWYRTAAYNKRVGGKRNSLHLKGIATDFWTDDFTPEEIAAALEGLIRIRAIPQGGIGVYPDFVHYDSRGTRSRWTG